MPTFISPRVSFTLNSPSLSQQTQERSLAPYQTSRNTSHVSKSSVDVTTNVLRATVGPKCVTRAKGVVSEALPSRSLCEGVKVFSNYFELTEA